MTVLKPGAGGVPDSGDYQILSQWVMGTVEHLLWVPGPSHILVITLGGNAALSSRGVLILLKFPQKHAENRPILIPDSLILQTNCFQTHTSEMTSGGIQP